MNRRARKLLLDFLLQSFALLLLSISIHFFVAQPSWAEESAESTFPRVEPRRGLVEYLEMAETRGHELDEFRAKILFSEAREALARSYGLPQGSLDVFFGPVPGATGDAVEGSTDWDQWGIFSASKVEVVQPLYTFGAISAGKEAARAGTDAEKSLWGAARLKLRSEVAEYYYSYQMAFELSELAEDVGSKLERALKNGDKLRAQKKRRAPSAADLDKLRVFLADIQVKAKEAIKGMKLAKAAMAWKTGLYGRGEPRWDRANLIAEDVSLQDLAFYQKVASAKRPELKALDLDVKAKKELLDVEELRILPVLYLGARATYSVATKREDQSSPYAYDPLNEQTGALVLGLKWNLGFFERRAKISQARAELIRAEARKVHLGTAIMVDVERAYLDLKHLLDARGARKEATRAAKRIFNDAFVAFTLGTGTAKELLESLGSYGLAEKSRLEAVAASNIAVFKLAQAVGVSSLSDKRSSEFSE